MHGFELISTLAGGLTAALVCGYVTQRMGLSPIVGYLLGGLLVGPYTPGFVADAALAEQLAEIGVVLLMFGVGLQFHFHELLAVWRVAVPGAFLQSAAATLVGAWVAHAFGWTWTAGFIYGVALAVASTVVLIRVLADHGDLHTPTGHIAVGWLVVEDLFTVLVLVLLPALVGAGGTPSALLGAFLGATLKMAVLVGLVVVGGRKAIPWLLDRVADTRSRELFTLTVLVLALGIAVLASSLFGVSMALGAFLAGLVVGQSDYSLRAASEALPMRDAFAVLFFVSIGMLLDPRSLVESPGIVLATLAIVVVVKPLVALLVVLLMRYPIDVALAVALALGQIGEFSFIVASLGADLGLLPRGALNTLVAVSIASILLNPLLYRALPAIRRRLVRARGTRDRGDAAEGVHGRPEAPARSRAVGAAHRAVIVGYGPTGRTLTRLLSDNGIVPTVIEMNRGTVRELRDSGLAAIYGDASDRATLEEAGTAAADNLILTAELPNSTELIRVAKELNPRIHVVARTAHLRSLAGLRAAGAEAAFSGEGEVALALCEAILHRLGATPEQMDRERSRVHSDLA